MLRTLNVLPLLLLLFVAGCTSLPPVTPAPDNYVAAERAEPRVLRNDQLALFGQWWVPEQPPKAVVLLVHGTLVHSGFYAPWAEQLRDAGYAVFGIDLRGWGQSQGHGRRGFVKSYDEYLRDLDVAHAEVQRRFPGLPLYLQGESMGGAVVLLASIGERYEIDGLVLNAPAVKPNPGLGFLRAPGKLGEFNLWAAGKVGKAGPNMPMLPIVDQSWALGWVMEDEVGQQRFMNDPIATHTALPSAYVSALQGASSKLKKNLGQVDEPLIILQGTSDVLVPASSSEFLLEKVASSDKTLKLYEGMNHATLHDTDREKVWQDIIAWLDARTARPAVAGANRDAAGEASP